MYKIIELIINMNGNFQGEIQIDHYYSIDQYPFQGKYELFQDEVQLLELEIVDEESNPVPIPQGFRTELKEEIKKYHGK